MSGGHFDYAQYCIEDIAREIEGVLLRDVDYESAAIRAKFHDAIRTLRRAAVMAQRIDWLVSGDDGEETFHRRWAEELAALEVTS